MPCKEKSGDASGAPEMDIFPDMMSLLLCFCLAFAMSSTEDKKMTRAAGSMKAAFGETPPLRDPHSRPARNR